MSLPTTGVLTPTATDFLQGVFTFLPIRCAKALSRVARSKKLHGDQLFDVICLGIIIMGVWVLRHVRPSWIYFWMKDITAEFMKIHAIYLALEISDKILCNFGVDVLESLSGTCTLFVTGDPRVGLRHLLPDSLLAFVTITMHGLVIMCHGMVWSVAMTSSQNTLVALLIASNFTEIKGTVYKRFDPSKLQDLACQDIVELFHLMLSMLFVAVEDMCNSNTSWPSSEVVKECTRIILAEIVVDIIKHAVLGKFSDVQPGVYREFFKDICDRAMHSQSHNAHRHMGFAPHGAAILAMRIVISVLFMGWQPGKSLPVSSWLARLSALGLAWSALFACKVALGYGIRIVAVGYSNHFNRRFGRPKTPRGIARTGSRAKAD
ncbi:unnamed protein product [Ostreobium quekettii]|uniref:Uncharacterized protein n=1 Tax=Ostreobium quekettii TaxID=121088 RepID=A0A8S1ITB8_9CHLO|nr:unnamed protein product [Ostreobium quekettii]|eukprot:evm.model.scf_707.4 EVM.evm.TU.scf_707.4   scf_707:25421-28310(-)